MATGNLTAMPSSWFLYATAGVSLLGAALWGRAAVFRMRFLRRIDRTSNDPEVRMLATGALSRDLHATLLYVAVAIVCAVAAVTGSSSSWYLLAGLLAPVAVTV